MWLLDKIEGGTASKRLKRWNFLFSSHDFEVVHIPGKQNTVADALSRTVVARISHKKKEEVKTRDLFEAIAISILEKDNNDPGNQIETPDDDLLEEEVLDSEI